MTTPKLHHVKITGGPSGTCGIELDGKPVKGVHRFELVASVKGPTRVMILFIPESIDVEVDALVVALQEEFPERPPLEHTDLDYGTGDGERGQNIDNDGRYPVERSADEHVKLQIDEPDLTIEAPENTTNRWID